VCEIKESQTRLRKSGTKEEVAMYHQTNPTETFRERQLALLREAENRRLGRRLLRAKRTPKARSTIAATGFLVALVVASLMLVALGSSAKATTVTVNSTADFADIKPGNGVCDADAATGNLCTLRAAIQQANATSGADTVNFNISAAFRNPISGVAAISPDIVLPLIIDPVSIDGFTLRGRWCRLKDEKNH
jgi:hypothetical protein